MQRSLKISCLVVEDSILNDKKIKFVFIMKFLIIFFVFCACLNLNVTAQNFEIGIQGGPGITTLRSVTNPNPQYDYNARWRSSIGIMATMQLWKSLSIRVDPSFEQKGSDYSQTVYLPLGEGGGIINVEGNFHLNYISFPI